jgi:hypothetical protein
MSRHLLRRGNPLLASARSTAAAVNLLVLAGCSPTLAMPEGAESARLRATALRFCEAVRSSDQEDENALFVPRVAEGLARLRRSPGADGARRLTSVDPAPRCEPGRTWYKGGSRTFAEVRLSGGSDRLEFWAGDGGRIRDVRYGRPLRIGGKTADSLAEALDAAAGEISRREGPT